MEVMVELVLEVMELEVMVELVLEVMELEVLDLVDSEETLEDLEEEAAAMAFEENLAMSC